MPGGLVLRRNFFSFADLVNDEELNAEQWLVSLGSFHLPNGPEEIELFSRGPWLEVLVRIGAVDMVQKRLPLFVRRLEVHPEDCPRLLVGGKRGPDVRDVMKALHSAAGKRLRCLKIEKLPGKKEWRCDDILPESDLGLSVAQTFGSPLG